MLILVRHGRTRANAAGQLLGRRDPGLDEVGWQQAVDLAEMVAGLSTGAISRVVSSPLIRCVETARVIIDRLDDTNEILIDRRFIEIDYGNLEGTPVADVAPEVWQRWRKDSSWAPGGGESLSEVSERVAGALDELADRCRVEALEDPSDLIGDVVIVTHVSPIKAAVGWALGVGPEISWRCRVGQASAHRIDVAARTPRLVTFNETHHLSR